MPMPHTIFGCANIGGQISRLDDVLQLLGTFRASGATEIDTAARYPPTSPGASQRLLGEAKVAETGFNVDTKIKVGSDPRGSLTAAAVDASIEESLASLGVSKVRFSENYMTPLV